MSHEAGTAWDTSSRLSGGFFHSGPCLQNWDMATDLPRAQLVQICGKTGPAVVAIEDGVYLGGLATFLPDQLAGRIIRAAGITS